jgi:hypothetical protein
LPQLPDHLRGAKLVVVEAVMLVDQDAGDRLLGPLRALRPERDSFAMVPPEALGSLHMDPPQPTPALGEQALLAALPEAAIEALLEVAGPGAASPLLAVELRHLGGALARPAPDGGALASLDAWIALIGAGVVADPGAAGPVGPGRPGWWTPCGPGPPASGSPTSPRTTRPTPRASSRPRSTAGSNGSRPRSIPATCSAPTTRSHRRRIPAAAPEPSGRHFPRGIGLARLRVDSRESAR